MRYNRVMLIRQNTKNMNFGPRRPPLGIGYLAEALRRNKIDYAIIDRELGYYTYEEIRKKIKAYNPDLIGISMVTLGYMYTNELISQLKEEFSVDIIIGGPHTSALREEVLKSCDAIDYASLSESDESLVELCQGKPLDQIAGLYYRANGEAKFTGLRPHIKNIDDMGFPTFEGFELEKYASREIGILTSRGCPYGCTFCAVHSIMGAKIRMRSPKSVVDELEYWYYRGYKTFLVMDDNFTFDRQRVFDICDEIEARKLSDIHLSLSNGVRADKVDEPMLRRLQQVGAWEIQMAVESANDRILKVLRKGEDMATIRKAVDLACRLNFDVGLCFLVGSPEETWEEVQNSFKFVDEYPLQLVFFFNIIPYPNTRLFNYLNERNLIKYDPKEYLGFIREGLLIPLFETPELSIKQREKLLVQARKVVEKVRRRHLCRRFKKFGPLAYPLAVLGSWHVTQYHLKRSRFIGKYIVPLYYNSKIKKLKSP